MTFDRAGTFAKRGLVPAAIYGRARAEDRKSAVKGAPFGSRADLAASAAERAAVAIRAKNREGARRAFEDVVKYTSERALRWAAPLHLADPGHRIVLGQGKRWHVQSGRGAPHVRSSHRHPPRRRAQPNGADRRRCRLAPHAERSRAREDRRRGQAALEGGAPGEAARRSAHRRDPHGGQPRRPLRAGRRLGGGRPRRARSGRDAREAPRVR